MAILDPETVTLCASIATASLAAWSLLGIMSENGSLMLKDMSSAIE
jgi:hypothetical protein